MNPGDDNLNRLQLYLSHDHPCSYLDERIARTLFADPMVEKSPWLYQQLIDIGFRRSGDLIYRPDCPACRNCISTRVPVDEFKPRRNQQRVWKRNLDSLQIVERDGEFDPDHYALFRRYIELRHPEGEMSDTTEEGSRQFLTAPWCDTRFIELWLDGRLVGVAVTDLLPRGLSAVYTFFDPDYARLSPGVFAILWQIELARQYDLPWLYLGYWIPGCRKMSYKTDYRPIQLLVENRWTPIEAVDSSFFGENVK
ncbi:MAG: arginyltransferase [Sedimenticola sp.]